MFRRFRLIALALPALAGCRTAETLNPPDLSNNNGLFTRFVSIGTSISAGFQSAGINDSTQQRSYQVLVAQQAGASFLWPSLNYPGCPAPFVNNVTPQPRVGGASSTACALRQQPIPFQVGNLAVPGLTAPDLFTNTGSDLTTYEKLQTFFLGGQTPWNAVKAARPTLLSIEIGSSDVIGAVASAGNPGDPDSVTTFDVFAANFTKFADSVATLNTRVVVYTVPDVTQIPFTSRGSVYWCLKNPGVCPGVPAPNPPFPPTFTVAANCAPQLAGGQGDVTLVPWTIGIAGLLRAYPPTLTPFNLDCGNDLQVVTPAEYANVVTTTDQINALIRSEATARGWAIVEAPPIFAQLRLQDGGVPLFPDLSAVPTGGAIGFGNWFSLDGFHPSSATHRVIADSTIAVINRTFDTQIPALP